MIVTSTSVWARSFAAVNPAKPAPMITTRGRCGTAPNALAGSACRSSSPGMSASTVRTAEDERRQQAVDGDRTGPARQDEDQHGGPGQMLDPVLRIDEGLDHRNHAQERQGRKPGEKPKEDQGGAAELEGGRDGCGGLRAQHRYPVFVGEQKDRGLPAQD